MKVKAIFFDVDGTLVDSVQLHAKAWRQSFLSFGFDVDQKDISRQIGKGSDQLIPFLLEDEGQSQEFGQRLSDAHDQIFQDRFLNRVVGFDMVAELFDRLLTDGKKIALASSAKGEDLAHYKKIAGIGEFDIPQASSTDVEQSKPNPDIFLAANRAVGSVDEDNCVVVGDSPWDVEAALRAGMHPVGLLCGGGSTKADLRSAGCEVFYRDIAELHEAYSQKQDSALLRVV